MRESWIDADDQIIRDDIVTIAKAKTGLSNFKSTGVLRGIVEIIAACVSFIYRSAINPIYDNATLDGATGSWLSCWGLLLGVARKQDNKTSGNFTGHSFGDGNIPEGAWIVVEGTELRYKVTEKVSFQPNVDFPIPIAAEFAGSDYNIGAQMNIRITRVIPGLDSLTVGVNWILTPGENAEEDEPYRERIRSRWRSQTLGDTKETYRYYAESVPGVSAAKIIRAPRGPGSTDVIITSVDGLPSPALIQAATETLHSHQLMAFDVQIKPPTVVAVGIEVEYSGGAEESEVALVAERYIHGLGIGGRFKLTDLYRKYDSLALSTIEIIRPERDVVPGDAAIINATISVQKIEAI